MTEVTLKETTPTTCALMEVTCSTSATFPLPISKADLINLIRTILSDAEMREHSDGPIMLSRTRDGIRVHHGSGMFVIGYAFIFPIVLGA